MRYKVQLTNYKKLLKKSIKVKCYKFNIYLIERKQPIKTKRIVTNR